MKILAAIIFFFLWQCGSAQEIPVVRSAGRAFVKGSRDKRGVPGRLYWQNKGDYDIRVSFDPVTRALSGSVGIDYLNNSPDTLKTLVFKLYPNFYKDDAMRNMPVAAGDLGPGVRIGDLTVDGQRFDSSKRLIRGTNMYLKGCRLLPGQGTHIDINYHYTLNKGSFVRTGQVDSGAFFIAYFFPRLAVYDDIDGWNEYPYVGKEEFYNDYGNFHAAITVPGAYQVWATGDLKNGKDLYAPKFLERIERAERSDTVTDIITREDLAGGPITMDRPTNTWIFEADHVTDLAFAMSNHYVWKASSVLVDPLTKRRTRVDAVFNPDHTDYVPVIGYARRTVALISDSFPKVPFPYPHETVFDGLDAMEYPMMVNNLPFQGKKEIIEFTAHEIFHSLFPFYVGTNETKHSFMDEGWATMAEFYLFPMIDTTVAVDYDISDVNNSAGTDVDVPIVTLTPQLYGKARYADKDLKPALGLYYLMEMLGDRVFLKAMDHYIDAWKGKHPTPYDFFNCMNTGSGVNLDWYWKNWYFEKNVPDLAIADVRHRGLDYTIVVSSPGSLAVPIHLTIEYGDGSKESVNRSVGCWRKGEKKVVLSVKARMAVRKVVLGNGMDADIHPEDNLWMGGGG